MLYLLLRNNRCSAATGGVSPKNWEAATPGANESDVEMKSRKC